MLHVFIYLFVYKSEFIFKPHFQIALFNLLVTW